MKPQKAQIATSYRVQQKLLKPVKHQTATATMSNNMMKGDIPPFLDQRLLLAICAELRMMFYQPWASWSVERPVGQQHQKKEEHLKPLLQRMIMGCWL